MPDEQQQNPHPGPDDASAETPSEATPEPEQHAAGDEQRNAAESLAQEALHAAQKAVADLSDNDDAGDDDTAAAAAALHAAQRAVAGLSGDGQGASSVDLPDLVGVDGAHGDMPGGLDLLDDVNLNVKIELGRTRMYLEDVLRLGEGSVVELDKLAGDPVDVYVNERHVARGEVLILNDNFCVRINEIVNAAASE